VWMKVCCKVCTEPGIRLSVEEIVQRNKGNQRRKSQEGERHKYSRKKSLKSSLKISDCEIRSQKKVNNSRPLDLVKLHGR
jgi:hypothetical protein